MPFWPRRLAPFSNNILTENPGVQASGSDLLFSSFTTLTTAGYGVIVPVLAPARSLAMVEQISGTLFVAILIARLAGVYRSARTHNDAG